MKESVTLKAKEIWNITKSTRRETASMNASRIKPSNVAAAFHFTSFETAQWMFAAFLARYAHKVSKIGSSTVAIVGLLAVPLIMQRKFTPSSFWRITRMKSKKMSKSTSDLKTMSFSQLEDICNSRLKISFLTLVDCLGCLLASACYQFSKSFSILLFDHCQIFWQARVGKTKLNETRIAENNKLLMIQISTYLDFFKYLVFYWIFISNIILVYNMNCLSFCFLFLLFVFITIASI